MILLICMAGPISPSAAMQQRQHYVVLININNARLHPLLYLFTAAPLEDKIQYPCLYDLQLQKVTIHMATQ